MENVADLLMLSGTQHWCDDCGGERILVPVLEGSEPSGCEFCCTACDAAVFLLPAAGHPARGGTGRPSRVA